MSNAESPNRARQLLLDRISQEFEVFQQALAPAADPISAMLRAHLFTEQILEAHIHSWLPKPEEFFKQRLSYRVKLELAGAFGAIEDRVLQSLRALNGVRNELAHKMDHDISEDDIKNIGTPLGDGFCKIRADHQGDLNTQIGKLLPYLAGILVAQTKGPRASRDRSSLKTGRSGKKQAKGK